MVFGFIARDRQTLSSSYWSLSHWFKSINRNSNRFFTASIYFFQIKKYPRNLSTRILRVLFDYDLPNWPNWRRICKCSLNFYF